MSGEGRRWLEVTAHASVTPDVGALIADGLVRSGARGVEERGESYVAWFDEPDDVDAFVDTVRAALEDEVPLPGLALEIRWQDHADWETLWKRGLGPRRVTDRIVVHPSWAPPEDLRPDDVVITIDPGMAFGTAEHGTTRGCLRLLDGRVRAGDRLLDVGSGSGILALASVGLGARHVVAIESDELAVEALLENVEAAGRRDDIEVVCRRVTSDDLAGYGTVDGVIANIETGYLVPLFDGFVRCLSAGGWLIVSGILEREWDDVRGLLLGRGFTLVASDVDGEWCSALLEAQGQAPPSA